MESDLLNALPMKLTHTPLLLSLLCGCVVIAGACSAPTAPPPPAEVADAIPDTSEAARVAAEAEVALAALHATVTQQTGKPLPHDNAADPVVDAALADVDKALADYNAMVSKNGGVDPLAPKLSPEEQAKAEAELARIQAELYPERQREEQEAATQGFLCRRESIQAKAALKRVWVAEELYKAENGSYTTDLSKLKLAARGGEDIAYDVTVVHASGDAFVAEAKGTGKMAGDLWRLTQDNDLTHVTDVCGAT